MTKRILSLGLVCGMLLVSSGCVALIAGAAGGAGTAVWLSGKLSQEVAAPFDKAVRAAQSALKALNYDVEKETQKDRLVQIISVHADGRQTWVDIHRVSKSVSRIEVRVGASGDKEAARELLDKIERYL